MYLQLFALVPMSEKKRIQTYPSPEITVQFDPNLCEHSGICIRRLPNVFNLQSRPWVNVKGASKDDIIALIDKCPSGALSWTTDQADTPHVDASGATEITIITNGPLRLAGHIRILDKEGNLLHEADKCSLCRCGGSANKPFCDGKHREIGFQG